MCTYVTAFMGSVVFCVGGCLPVLLDASFATAAIAETVISHLVSLDVAGMMSPLHFTSSIHVNKVWVTCYTKPLTQEGLPLIVFYMIVI